MFSKCRFKGLEPKLTSDQPVRYDPPLFQENCHIVVVFEALFTAIFKFLGTKLYSV